jgi:hypothetical protein
MKGDFLHSNLYGVAQHCDKVKTQASLPVHSLDIKPLLFAQSNKAVVRRILNDLLLNNPATNPTLCKILEEMGLSGDKPVLHPEHPVVVGCGVAGEFILCPVDTTSASSLSDSAVETNAQFIDMLGKLYFLTRLID